MYSYASILQLIMQHLVYMTMLSKFNTSQTNPVFCVGLLVFLDVAPGDILKRLERMKVNRIVGQEANTPMKDILAYRQQFYEQ